MNLKGFRNGKWWPLAMINEVGFLQRLARLESLT